MTDGSIPAPAGAVGTGIPIVNYQSLVAAGEREASLLDLRRLEEAGAGSEGRLRKVLARGDKLVSEAVGDVEKVPLTAVLPRIESLLREETRNPDVLVAPRDKWTARFQSIVASSALAAGPDAFLEGGVVKFSSQHDYLDWAKAFVEAWFEREWRTHPFIQPQGPDLVNRPELHLALFSDWGTGMYGAPRIKAAVEGIGGFDYVVHLGDTYYTGEPHEVGRALLGDWPEVPGAVNRALNGNHEMYSGGNAYFDDALPRFDQQSSVFALQTEHWLIVGLDSAYEDWDLGEGQEQWLFDLVARAGDRRLILLTHHQPFSNTSSEQGPQLQVRLKPLLDSRRIFAWYWGHEHVCAIYDQHPAWGLYGRCLGNGGMPEPRPWYSKQAAQEEVSGVGFYAIKGSGTNPPCLGLDGPNPYIAGHEDEYTAHGFMTLEVVGSRLREVYRNADGEPLLTRELD